MRNTIRSKTLTSKNTLFLSTKLKIPTRILYQTAISHSYKINSAIQANPRWASCVTTPRKWFWIPQNSSSFYVTAHNIGSKKKSITTQLPSVYAIIADAIDIHQPLPMTEKEKNKLVLQLCN